MVVDTLIEEIQDLNLTYLLLVQRLLRKDRATAIFRLKLSEEMANLLAGLSGKQLVQLARTNQLICRPGFEDAGQLMKVLNNSREPGLARLHASLLMISADQSVGSQSVGRVGNAES
ncbi:flagellar transcriptional regulator FlhD [Azotobacter salinestris]|uniref:flagellar transcriptional regulator FlhD n=1 Tax=Azotobacter salinestris TaxID=69964 RepID=UPI001266C9FA|nr:flagellar transcriptional regulator FlhD [Azotobacter salinestris]